MKSLSDGHKNPSSFNCRKFTIPRALSKCHQKWPIKLISGRGKTHHHLLMRHFTKVLSALSGEFKSSSSFGSFAAVGNTYSTDWRPRHRLLGHYLVAFCGNLLCAGWLLHFQQHFKFTLIDYERNAAVGKKYQKAIFSPPCVAFFPSGTMRQQKYLLCQPYPKNKSHVDKW